MRDDAIHHTDNRQPLTVGHVSVGYGKRQIIRDLSLRPMLPGTLTGIGAVAAIGAIAQRVANMRNQRITLLPSTELLYEWAVLALLAAAVALLWQIRDRTRL